MTEPLPAFRYHPDPLATGNVVPSDGAPCDLCGKDRGFLYTGPYATPDMHYENEDPLCPWCIADGTAAAEWGASFAEPGYLSPAARHAMAPDRLAELEQRTASFRCLQQERWLDHHDEAAAYLGEIGFMEYRLLPAEAQTAVRRAAGDRPDASLGENDQVTRLRADGDGPAVYLFRCLHCGEHLAYLAAA